jgi:hypothetical protein
MLLMLLMLLLLLLLLLLTLTWLSSLTLLTLASSLSESSDISYPDIVREFALLLARVLLGVDDVDVDDAVEGVTVVEGVEEAKRPTGRLMSA